MKAKDIVDTAVEAGSCGTLVAAVQAEDLVETLKGEEPVTIVASTNAAFEALPAGRSKTCSGRKTRTSSCRC